MEVNRTHDVAGPLYVARTPWRSRVKPEWAWFPYLFPHLFERYTVYADHYVINTGEIHATSTFSGFFRRSSAEAWMRGCNEAMEESRNMIELPLDFVLKLIGTLSLVYIYALKDSHPEELGDDFKPWKWDDSEVEFAERASKLHRQLLDETFRQRMHGLSTEDYGRMSKDLCDLVFGKEGA